jgi:hypothetical protein
MYTQIHKGNLIYDLFVPATWADFLLFCGMGIFFLLVAARLARVRIGSLPINPIYWHYAVVANTRLPPIAGETQNGLRIYRAYMFFWVASICCFAAGALVLVSMLFAGSSSV